MKKKNVTYAYILIAILSLALASVSHARAPSGPTIADLATGTPEFSTLVEAVVKADLVDTLNGRRQFTVFAPDNQAFDDAAEALGFENGPALVAALDAGTLANILLYHVAPGRRDASEVLESSRLRTMNKSFLFVHPEDVMLIGVGTNANIIATDIDASNGIIHVIDFVLLPFALE